MAIDDLLDEHEQSERVRNWLRHNGAGLIGGIALGLVVILGWQWWQKHRHEQDQQAYAQYEQALKSLAAGDLKKAKADVDALKDGSGAYATLATLRLAKAQVDGGQIDAAMATLRSARVEAALQPVVDQRLARLLLESGKSAEALKVLGTAEDATSLEVRGDALVASGKPDDARAAYLKALTRMDVAAPERRLVEIKLTHVGGTPPEAAEST